MKIILTLKILAFVVYTLLLLDNVFADSNEKFKILFFDTSKIINVMIYSSITILVIYSIFKTKKHGQLSA